jgi:hypothetical protein
VHGHTAASSLAPLVVLLHYWRVTDDQEVREGPAGREACIACETLVCMAVKLQHL